MAARAAAAMLAMQSMAGRGRGIVAQQRIPVGTLLLQCTPICKVVKEVGGAGHVCRNCLRPVAPSARFCCGECSEVHMQSGGEMLDRIDLSKLEHLHASQGRKFPLLVSQLLADLLAGIKRERAAPPSWTDATSMCYAELAPEALPQLQDEYDALIHAFTPISPQSTLEMVLPFARYQQLLGAAQLNAFELRTSHGLVASCLLPGAPSLFNHSCMPNALVSVGECHGVGFVAGNDIEEGEECCISCALPQRPFDGRLKEGAHGGVGPTPAPYQPACPAPVRSDVETDASDEERQQILQNKYGFRCRCPRCVAST